MTKKIDIATLERELTALDEKIASYRARADRLSDIVEGGPLDDEARHDLDALGGDRDALLDRYEDDLFEILQFTFRLEALRDDFARELETCRSRGGA